MSEVTREQWNSAIAGLPGAHILQSWEWAQFKALAGWKMLPQLWRDEAGAVRAAAMVLRREAPGGMNVLYAPRGPLVDWNDPRWRSVALDGLKSLARRQGSIFLKIDPELVLGYGVPGTETEQPVAGAGEALSAIQAAGWKPARDQVQFRNTVIIDLTGAEADWLARMKQKTRYNIRLAERKGVTVRLGVEGDLPLLYRLYAETSVRDGFVIREEGYYLHLWKSFLAQGLAQPLVAEVEGEPVAAMILFLFAGRAWYFYGMSREAHREKMPNYLLQWEAMRFAKARGCNEYDLWGAPDVFDDTDSMWGVFRFKEGLGGRVVRTAGAWDFAARPLLYALYTRVMPALLDRMRRRRKASTQQEVAV